MPAEPTLKRKGTGVIVRQGHTAKDFGSDPAITAKSNADNPPRDLKP